MIKPIITGIVWSNDISELLLSNWLWFAVVFLLQLVHHGNYTVETFGHAGPHSVLKERNAQSVVRFLLRTWFPGWNCNTNCTSSFFLMTSKHKITYKGICFYGLRCLPVQKINRKLLSGWLDITHKVFGLFPAFFFCSLSSICLQMNRCFLHRVCANATICASLRPVSGRVYFGCCRHMVWI